MDAKLSFVISEFLRFCYKNRTKGTSDNYKRILHRFLMFAKDVDCSKLRARDLVQWSNKWHEIQAVQRCFSWAVLEAEILEKNPFRRVQKPSLGQRRRILDRPTFARLLRISSRDFRRFLFAMMQTLCRPQEIRLMRWEYIQFDNTTLTMVQALEQGQAMFVLYEYKSSTRRIDPNCPRVVPISRALGRLIARLSRKVMAKAGPVFTTASGLPWTSNAVRLRVQWARRRLGLLPDHRGENIVAYTLRHTMATWAASRGVRDRTLADLMGHASTRTTARYQHLQIEHLAEALRSIHERRKRAG